MARRDTKNRTKYWCSNHVPGMSLLLADFTAHDYAPHRHDAYVIALTESGGADVTSGRVTEAVSPAVLFVSNPGENQSARMGTSKQWLYRSVYLTRPATTFIAGRLGIGGIPRFAKSMFRDTDLVGRFARLHRAFETEADALPRTNA
ncbi:MAG TPA: AraC family ligand binding domain-containing protein [Rhodopila sp.]|uniref:AraC family ligand binding domain-containing protein n=1 Tax=Rhodopila sp. TaxID=2480087 RepID=UPI002D18B7F0|nr:AraC family ligand binding domain-containing protein [Rhodopila sp.]HVY16100.1 AraC family ligand binding domain-containing protein [Rhodopila sp.]